MGRFEIVCRRPPLTDNALQSTSQISSQNTAVCVILTIWICYVGSRGIACPVIDTGVLLVCTLLLNANYNECGAELVFSMQNICVSLFIVLIGNM